MNRLKANEIVRLFNECNNGSMVAGTVSDFVNSYSFDSAGFVKEMIAQPKKHKSYLQILVLFGLINWAGSWRKTDMTEEINIRSKQQTKSKVAGRKLEKSQQNTRDIIYPAIATKSFLLSWCLQKVWVGNIKPYSKVFRL